MENFITNEDLEKLIKDGHFFGFCVGFALNKGYRNAIREKNEVKFTVGEYNVSFDHAQMCFVLTHQNYFARIITAYYTEVIFIGDDEKEVINDLLAEFQKEFVNP